MNTPVSMCLTPFKILYRTLVVNYSLSLINLIEKRSDMFSITLFIHYFHVRYTTWWSPRCKDVASKQRRRLSAKTRASRQRSGKLG